MISRIQIGPMTYQVKFSEDLHRDDDEEGIVHKYDGLHESFNQLIEIRSTNAPTYQLVVLLHEIMHDIYTVAGHREDHPEDFIDAVSYGLVELFRQNPDLISFVQACVQDPSVIQRNSSHELAKSIGTDQE